MANKLKVNKKKTSSSRYFKGLSVAEMDDVEQSVEEALENPAGTFTIVTQELNFRLSNMQKSIKTIGIDTKYIRKAIDKLDKKLDDIRSGGSGFNLGDAASLGAGALALRGGATALATKGASRFAGRALLGRAGLIGLTALAVHEVMNYVDPPDESGESSLDKWLGRNVFDLNGKMYEWTGIGVDRKKYPLYDKVNQTKKIIDRLTSATMVDSYNKQSPSAFKELTPTERAEIISKKLKIMTEIPNTATKQTIPEPIDAGAPVSPIQNVPNNIAPELPKTPGTLNQGTTGGGFSGGGGGGWSEDNTTTPSAVPSTSSPPSTTPQKDVIVGTGKLKGVQERMKMVYDGYRSAGFSDKQARALTAEVGRENGYNPDIMFGTHVDPHNKKVNLGMLSMQGSRGTGLYNHMKSRGLIDKDGKMIHSQESINAMAEYTRKEMETNPDYSKTKKEFLDNPNIDPEQAAGVLGRNYIRWRMDDPRYASHNIKRQNYLKDITKITSDSQFKEPEKIASASPPSVEKIKPETDTTGIGSVKQKQQGKIRGQLLNEKTESQLRYVSEKAGVEIEVTSGEQMDLKKAIAMGARKEGKKWILPDGTVARTGSTRHDESTGAADVKLKDPKTGKYYDMETAEGRAKAQEVVKYATQAGMTGFGYGVNYMGRETMHLGGGTEASWKTTKSGAGQVEWIEKAREHGKKLPSVNAIDWFKQQKNEVGKLNVQEANARNLPPTSPLAMTPERRARILANAKKQTTITKSSDDSYFSDRYSPSLKKKEKETNLTAKQEELVKKHRAFILDKNSDPKPPVKKKYDTTPFNELFPNFSTAADPNFGAKKITPENNPTDVAIEMSKKALEESKIVSTKIEENTKDLIKKSVATPAPKLPQSSANKPPLSNLPKTAKKNVSNPTDKTPGTDSAKTNKPVPLEDLPFTGFYFP